MANFSVLNYWRSHRHFEVMAVILIVIGLAWDSEGLRLCYNCNTTVSLDCVHNPSNVTDGESSCKGFCTIRRKEYVNMRENENLISLERSCEVNPKLYDEVVIEGYFKMYFRTCRSYLCNRGSGVESLRDIPVDPSWDLYPDEDLDANSAFHARPFALLQLSSLSIALTVMLMPYLILT